MQSFDHLSSFSYHNTDRKRAKDRKRHLCLFLYCFDASYTHRGCSSVNFTWTMCSRLKAEFVLLRLLLLQSKRKTTIIRTAWLYFFFYIHFYMRLLCRVLNTCIVVFLVSCAQKLEIKTAFYHGFHFIFTKNRKILMDHSSKSHKKLSKNQIYWCDKIGSIKNNFKPSNRFHWSELMRWWWRINSILAWESKVE